jgi:hypothetical protein
MLNACELEIDLFCKGLRVPEDVSLTGTRARSPRPLSVQRPRRAAGRARAAT